MGYFAVFVGVIVALSVVVLMVLTSIVTWEDIISYKQTWNVFVWFTTLITLANGLKTVGFVPWFTKDIPQS